jgi:hypothetical protein
LDVSVDAAAGRGRTNGRRHSHRSGREERKCLITGQMSADAPQPYDAARPVMCSTSGSSQPSAALVHRIVQTTVGLAVSLGRLKCPLGSPTRSATEQLCQLQTGRSFSVSANSRHSPTEGDPPIADTHVRAVHTPALEQRMYV